MLVYTLLRLSALFSVAFYTERNEPHDAPAGVHFQPDSYTYAEALKEVSRLANVLKVSPLSVQL